MKREKAEQQGLSPFSKRRRRLMKRKHKDFLTVRGKTKEVDYEKDDIMVGGSCLGYMLYVPDQGVFPARRIGRPDTITLFLREE
jgi:hypothetical protein